MLARAHGPVVYRGPSSVQRGSLDVASLMRSTRKPKVMPLTQRAVNRTGYNPYSVVVILSPFHVARILHMMDAVVNGGCVTYMARHDASSRSRPDFRRSSKHQVECCMPLSSPFNGEVPTGTRDRSGFTVKSLLYTRNVPQRPTRCSFTSGDIGQSVIVGRNSFCRMVLDCSMHRRHLRETRAALVSITCSGK